VLGPGSFGIAVPSIGLNASRAHLVPPAGRIGLISQSASLCRAVVDWAGPNGVGFSHIVGIGGRADIGFGQVLDWLSRDPGTGAILIDIRQLRNRRSFLSAARAASRLRPVVAIRAGGSVVDPSGAADRAFEAALRRAGVLCVTSLEDLLAAAEILARARPVRSEALSIVTNAITAGRMAADAALRNGLLLATDVVHVEPGESARLAALASAAAGKLGVGGVLVIHAPSGEADQNAIASLAESRDTIKVPLLVCASPRRSRHGRVRHAGAGGPRLPAPGA
jgi:acetyltransferase